MRLSVFAGCLLAPMPPRPLHAMCWNVGLQDTQLTPDIWVLDCKSPLSARLRDMCRLATLSEADVIMFQECGGHGRESTQAEVFAKFLVPLNLHELFEVAVHGSYWSLCRRGRVALLSGEHRACGGGTTRSFQRAQVLVVQLIGQGDGTNSPVTFVNLHLPSSAKKKLTAESRKHHFRAATALAGDNGIIMGDLNTLGQDRRPIPRQCKVSSEHLFGELSPSAACGGSSRAHLSASDDNSNAVSLRFLSRRTPANHRG